MPEGPPPAPAVQKLRLRYAKRGRLRFASHRDFQRALERAVRRTGLPVAFSAGFSPHPKISYAGAAPTGAASEAEYLEISLTRRLDPEQVRASLDTALPDGLDVLDVVEAGPGALAERLEASLWRVELAGVRPEAATAAVATLLALPRAEVQRMTKNGLRTFDVRAALLAAQVGGGSGDGAGPVVVGEAVPDGAVSAGPGQDALVSGGSGPAENPGTRVAQVDPVPCAILHLVVRHATPAVRPDDILSALRSQADLAPPSSPRMTRLAQGPLDEVGGSVADPLTIDRGVGGA